MDLIHEKCLSKLDANIKDLMEIKSLKMKNYLIEDWMKIDNYDITKLTNDEKSDFKKYLRS